MYTTFVRCFIKLLIIFYCMNTNLIFFLVILLLFCFCIKYFKMGKEKTSKVIFHLYTFSPNCRFFFCVYNITTVENIISSV